MDRPSGKLPARSSSDGAELSDEDSPRAETIHARSVLLSDENLGAIARIDLIEGQRNVVTPVDYKHGRVPDVPERAWEPERVQLCIQGLLLRAHGYICNEGLLYFVQSRRREAIPFDDCLVRRILELLSGDSLHGRLGPDSATARGQPKMPTVLSGRHLRSKRGELAVTPSTARQTRRCAQDGAG